MLYVSDTMGNDRVVRQRRNASDLTDMWVSPDKMTFKTYIWKIQRRRREDFWTRTLEAVCFSMEIKEDGRESRPGERKSKPNRNNFSNRNNFQTINLD